MDVYSGRIRRSIINKKGTLSKVEPENLENVNDNQHSPNIPERKIKD